jgi:hypothetical protein
MFFIDLLLALVIAVIVGLILTRGFRRSGPWTGVAGFFLLLFLATWAAGVWLVPFGPVMFGAYVLPFLFGALIVGLLLAAVSPPGPTGPEPLEEGQAAALGLSMFFWALIIALVVVILVAYLAPVEPVAY